MVNSLSCPVCENLCSTQAVSCPKCGHPINQPTQNADGEHVISKEVLPIPTSTGSVLRTVLWVFFAISLLYALGAIGIWRDMPLPLIGDANTRYHEAQFAIGYHIAPLILMIIILAITYSAKER